MARTHSTLKTEPWLIWHRTRRWRTYLVGDDGTFIDDADVQLARVVAVVH